MRGKGPESARAAAVPHARPALGAQTRSKNAADRHQVADPDLETLGHALQLKKDPLPDGQFAVRG